MSWRRALGRLAPLRPEREKQAPSASSEPSDIEPLSLDIADLTVPDPTSEPDPRRAVIACYLQLLEVAARHGPERRPSETPTEYLRRALTRTEGAAGPATSLTGLFEQARYSLRPVDESMRSRAIAALAALKSEVLNRSDHLTRALWAMFLTMAALVGIALAIALGVGAPHPAIIERAAAGAFGLIGLGAGSIALSTAVDPGTTGRRRPRPSDEDLVDAGQAGLLGLERSLRFGASSAGDFHAQVRPRLIRLTTARLAREASIFPTGNGRLRFSVLRLTRSWIQKPGRLWTVFSPASRWSGCACSSPGSRSLEISRERPGRGAVTVARGIGRRQDRGRRRRGG